MEIKFFKFSIASEEMNPCVVQLGIACVPFSDEDGAGRVVVLPDVEDGRRLEGFTKFREVEVCLYLVVVLSVDVCLVDTLQKVFLVDIHAGSEV